MLGELTELSHIKSSSHHVCMHIMWKVACHVRPHWLEFCAPKPIIVKSTICQCCYGTQKLL